MTPFLFTTFGLQGNVAADRGGAIGKAHPRHLTV